MKLDLHPERKLLRQFAWASLCLFPLIALYLAWRHDLPRPWIIALCALGVGIAAVQLVLVETTGALGATLEKVVTRSIYVTLMLVAWPIGFVVSHVLMATIYYLVITPIGLVFRVTGRDQLGRRLDPARSSYWHDRGAPRAPSSYFKLY